MTADEVQDNIKSSLEKYDHVSGILSSSSYSEVEEIHENGGSDLFSEHEKAKLTSQYVGQQVYLESKEIPNSSFWNAGVYLITAIHFNVVNVGKKTKELVSFTIKAELMPSFIRSDIVLETIEIGIARFKNHLGDRPSLHTPVDDTNSQKDILINLPGDVATSEDCENGVVSKNHLKSGTGGIGKVPTVSPVSLVQNQNAQCCDSSSLRYQLVQENTAIPESTYETEESAPKNDEGTQHKNQAKLGDGNSDQTNCNTESGVACTSSNDNEDDVNKMDASGVVYNASNLDHEELICMTIREVIAESHMMELSTKAVRKQLKEKLKIDLQPFKRLIKKEVQKQKALVATQQQDRSQEQHGGTTGSDSGIQNEARGRQHSMTETLDHSCQSQPPCKTQNALQKIVVSPIDKTDDGIENCEASKTKDSDIRTAADCQRDLHKSDKKRATEVSLSSDYLSDRKRLKQSRSSDSTDIKKKINLLASALCGDCVEGNGGGSLVRNSNNKLGRLFLESKVSNRNTTFGTTQEPPSNREKDTKDDAYAQEQGPNNAETYFKPSAFSLQVNDHKAEKQSETEVNSPITSPESSRQENDECTQLELSIQPLETLEVAHIPVATDLQNANELLQETITRMFHQNRELQQGQIELLEKLRSSQNELNDCQANEKNLTFELNLMKQNQRNIEKENRILSEELSKLKMCYSNLQDELSKLRVLHAESISSRLNGIENIVDARIGSLENDQRIARHQLIDIQKDNIQQNKSIKENHQILLEYITTMHKELSCEIRGTLAVSGHTGSYGNSSVPKVLQDALIGVTHDVPDVPSSLPETSSRSGRRRIR